MCYFILNLEDYRLFNVFIYKKVIDKMYTKSKWYIKTESMQ